jgi:hypothetical protein
LIKERLDLEPKLRELDKEVEGIELRLRSLLRHTIGGELTQVPPHILQKVDQRISSALKKNAALDTGHYATPGGMLEYFDLRDLQDCIVSKILWGEFEKTFSTKEQPAKKFDQLAELRNGIRHSRTVDQVARKEGEAAVMWFNQVLSGIVAHHA